MSSHHPGHGRLSQSSNCSRKFIRICWLCWVQDELSAKEITDALTEVEVPYAWKWRRNEGACTWHCCGAASPMLCWPRSLRRSFA